MHCLVLSEALRAATMICLAVADTAGLPDALEIEGRAIAARQAIKSGEVEIKVEHWDTRRGDRKDYDEELAVYFGGDNSRIERRQIAPVVTKAPDGTAAKDTYVFTKDGFMKYTDAVGSDGVPVMATIGIVDNIRIERRDIHMLDPRRIGLTPSIFGVLHAVGMDVVLTRADRTRSSIESETMGEEQVWRIEYERKDGLVARMWIAPEKNYGVLRVELEGVSKVRGPFLNVAESRLKLYDGEVWFPEAVTIRHTAGDEVVLEEAITISRATFNRPVDPALFTLKGLGMPTGHHVFVQATSTHGTFDGEEIVSSSAPVEGPGHVDPAGQSRKAWLYLSLGSGVAAAIVVYLLLRRGARTAK